MEKDKFLPVTDKEVEILLKEYEALRAEITVRIQAQTQFTTITIFLIGGVTAAIPFIISSDAHGLQIRIPLIYLVLVLIITSTLFTSLAMASMWHDIQMAYMAQYFYRNLRIKSSLLSGGTSVFNWDHYRVGIMFPTFNKSRPLTSTIAIVVLNSAQYLLMLVPATLSLIVAAVLYLTNFSILPANPVGLLNICLFILNLFYLLATVPCIRYIARAYEEGPSYHTFR